MKIDEIFLVDTNIIVYAYEIENSERKKKSMEILEKCWKNELTLAVSNQNLAEFSVVSLKKLEKHKMSFWNSLITATMIENGIFNIYTENDKDFKMPSLNVINPFK